MSATVFSLEWLLACRRGRHHQLRAALLLVLLVEAIPLFSPTTWSLIFWPSAQAQVELIERFQSLLYLLVWQQPIAICLLAPAMSAGSISDEKQRGTLDFLLLSPLSSTEIILGKWLGLSSQIFVLVCPAYAIIAVAASLLGGTLLPLVWLLASHLLLIGAVTALGLLASVGAHTSTRAVLAVYLLLGAALAAARATDLAFFDFDFNDLANANPLPRRAPIGGAFALFTLVCLTLAIIRLRPAHERQRTRDSSSLSTDRQDHLIQTTPMRWKERYAGGWLAIPIWRSLPHACRFLFVMLATAGMVFIGPVSEEKVILLAFTIFLLSGIWLGLRCAGSITSEREKQTWDALLVSRMDAYQLVRGKLWGNLDTLRPYALAYLLPALVGAWWTGWSAVFAVAYLWLAGWVFMYYLAACGLHASAHSTSTWRSFLALFRQAGIALGQGAALCAAPLVVVLSLFSCFFTLSSLTLLLICLVIPGLPMLLWVFAFSEGLLQEAETRLILTENAAGRKRS